MPRLKSRVQIPSPAPSTKKNPGDESASGVFFRPHESGAPGPEAPGTPASRDPFLQIPAFEGRCIPAGFVARPHRTAAGTPRPGASPDGAHRPSRCTASSGTDLWTPGGSVIKRSRPAPARCRSARRNFLLAPQAAPRNPPHRPGSTSPGTFLIHLRDAGEECPRPVRGQRRCVSFRGCRQAEQAEGVGAQ